MFPTYADHANISYKSLLNLAQTIIPYYVGGRLPKQAHHVSCPGIDFQYSCLSLFLQILMACFATPTKIPQARSGPINGHPGQDLGS